MGLDWQGLYAERYRVSQESPLGDLLRYSSMPDLISLAGGYPASELFPVKAFRDAFDAVLATDAGAALQYGPAEGYLPLREFLAERMSRFGISASPEEVLITHGSQQGIDLVARLFVDPGSLVAVEDPSYVGGLQAFDGYEARYLVIPTDEEGMQVDRLEEAMARGDRHPRLIYELPNFQNPSGATLSLERRHRLLELSYRYGIPILEDDPYGELRYEGEDLPSLKSMDGEGNVIYLGTFSKILVPGLRLGWVVAPAEVIHRLLRGKEAADLHTNSLAQRAAYEVCRNGLLDRHVGKMKPVYRRRRDTMLRSLRKHLPEGARWSRPEGGLFLWVQLPGGVDTAAMLADAVREKVAYVPGSAFNPRREKTSAMRLNFSSRTPSEIEEGIRRLGRVGRRWSEQARQSDGPVLPVDLAPAA
ncbi:MAG: PLP-dependent aminotransferase family protein [Actinobacteria bacterium]|nr:PLP-dependent aminotransferase family protein [Actinomycetota bacterium]